MLLGLIQGRHKFEITPLGCGGGSKTLSVRFSALIDCFNSRWNMAYTVLYI